MSNKKDSAAARTASAAPTFRTTRRNWVSVNALADELQVHPKTVRRWIREGRLTAYHVGGGLRIDRDDLGDVVARRVQPGDLRGVCG